MGQRWAGAYGQVWNEAGALCQDRMEELLPLLPSALEEKSCIKAVGFDMTKNAAGKLYNKTGLGAGDVQVVELHDCFSANELVTYEALGLCPEGGAGAFIDAGDNTYGGKFVVNPS